MPAAHKGAIGLDLIHIPVALHTATQDNDIHFNQLCKKDGSRVRYKKIRANCGKEIGFQDVVKKFEFAPGEYVTMTDADFGKAKTEEDETIQILHLTDIANVRPICFDRAYHAVVETGGDKAYELLRWAVLEKKKVVIARTVMGQSKELLCPAPTEKGILVETLFFADEVKEILKEAVHQELNQPELNMAKILVGFMDKPFESSLYHDEYQKRLREIIEVKINGQDIVRAPAEQPDNIIDLMDALQASLKQMEQKPNTPPGTPHAPNGAEAA